MSLFYWVYSKHMDLIKTLLLNLHLGKKSLPPSFWGKLSNKNNVVAKSLELYCFSPDVYFDDISEFEKDNCFIESVDDISPVDALVRGRVVHVPLFGTPWGRPFFCLSFSPSQNQHYAVST